MIFVIFDILIFIASDIYYNYIINFNTFMKKFY